MIGETRDLDEEQARARSPWVCVQTLAGREKLAGHNVARFGVEAYVPRYAKVITHARRRRQVQCAFFPGYFFAAVGENLGAVAQVNRSVGVVSVVGGKLGDMRVPEDLIAALRSREETDGSIPLVSTRFRRGQAVRISEGALNGMDAVFSEMSDANRAVILISLLGKSHRVRLPEGSLVETD